MTTEKLTKVHVDLPNHWAVQGEFIWAQPHVGNLYVIRNVPFFSFGLNLFDVVEALPTRPDLKPSVLRVVRRSGHRTLRVIFIEAAPQGDRVPLLESLRGLGVVVERADDNLFALDINPTGNYQAVCDRLATWDNAGLLGYETCEPRVEGSFDDRPSS